MPVSLDGLRDELILSDTQTEISFRAGLKKRRVSKDLRCRLNLVTDQKVWCVVEVNQTKVLQQTTRSHDSTCVHLTDGVSKLSLKQHILWVNAALLFLHLVYNFSKAKTFFGTLTAKLKYILIYSTKYFMQVHLHRPICYNPEAHRNVWSFL